MPIRTTTLAAATAALLVSAPAAATETYQFDAGHTEIQFSWTHAGITTQSAEFTGFDGSIAIDREA